VRPAIEKDRSDEVLAAGTASRCRAASASFGQVAVFYAQYPDIQKLSSNGPSAFIKSDYKRAVFVPICAH